jgi:hypothetical protein
MDAEREVGAEREMKEWCLALPKVELHAHLNGSVRNSTLLSVPSTSPPPSLIFLRSYLLSSSYPASRFLISSAG